jgi:RNA polymerase sigma factor (sigma-70 family)
VQDALHVPLPPIQGHRPIQPRSGRLLCDRRHIPCAGRGSERQGRFRSAAAVLRVRGDRRHGLRPVIVRHVPVARPDLEAERELCESARAGDREALGKLLRTYGPMLYRSVLLPRLGAEALAQDALAETYARVVERFSQFQWQSVGVYPWLRVVALRIALDILRSRRRETLYQPEDLEREIDRSERDWPASGEAEMCEKHDLADARARVEAALGRINPRYAEAIRLRVLEEHPREEVARTLGVSVATFDVVLHRALTALKKVLAAGAATAEGEMKEALR